MAKADLGAIFAGGQGRRMGGIDKGLIELGDRPLWQIVSQRLAPQAHAIAVLAPAAPVWLDGVESAVWIEDDPAIQGPAAGLAAALALLLRTSGPGASLLTTPVDAPFLPPDLFEQTSAVRDANPVVMTQTQGRLHPVFGLWRAGVAQEFAVAARADASLRRAAERLGYSVCAAWDGADPDPFLNLNTPADLSAAEAILGNRA